MLKIKNFSLASRGLRYKLRISFYLTSVLPLLVCIYLVSNYILPRLGLRLDIGLSILISIFIAIVGFYVIKEIFDRVLSVTTEAKLIAAGDISRKLEIPPLDEVGDLAESLNLITERIRSNMYELKTYSDKTTKINIEVQKHILTLGSLLQISSLISQGIKLEEVIIFVLQKARLLTNSDLSYLLYKKAEQDTFYMRAADGVGPQDDVLKIIVESQGNIFSKLIQSKKPLILDEGNILPEDLKLNFCRQFDVKNTLALAVTLKGKVMGILGIGNNQTFYNYRKEDMDLMEILVKQLAIAVENDMLTHQLEKLDMTDALTGLYNETFIRNRLKEEIKRAIIYHRPCAFILVDINDFQKFRINFGSLEAESALKKAASLIKNSVSEIDRVARIGDNEFAVVLPERNKRMAREIAAKIKKNIESDFSKEKDLNKQLTVSEGISENPLDGVEAEELFSKAKKELA